jgi:hypothetical protein
MLFLFREGDSSIDAPDSEDNSVMLVQQTVQKVAIVYSNANGCTVELPGRARVVFDTRAPLSRHGFSPVQYQQ